MENEVAQISIIEEQVTEPAPLPTVEEPVSVDIEEEPLTPSESVPKVAEVEEVDEPMKEIEHVAQEIELEPDVPSTKVSEECKAVILEDVTTPYTPVKPTYS